MTDTVTEAYYEDSDYVTDSTVGSFVEVCEPSNEQELTVKAFQTPIFILVFLLGVTGNSLVIATFTLYRRLRLRSLTDVFLLHLALSDLLLLLTLPLQTAEILMGSWMFGQALCKVNGGTNAVNTYSGLLLLACISADRYLVVVRARTAQRLRPSMLRYSKFLVLSVVVVAMLLSLPYILFFSVVKRDEASSSCEIVSDDSANSWMKLWTHGLPIGGFCVPFAVMLACYCAIGRILVRGGGQAWRRQRTLRLLVALVVVFLVFQLPHAVATLLLMARAVRDCDDFSQLHLWEHVTHSLVYVRCCLNPVLYALVGVRFRDDVLRLLHGVGCGCVARWVPHRDGGSSVTPSSPPPTMLSPLPSLHVPHKAPMPCPKLPPAPPVPKSLLFSLPPYFKESPCV